MTSETGNPTNVQQDSLLHVQRNQTVVEKFSSMYIFCNNVVSRVWLMGKQCQNVCRAYTSQNFQYTECLFVLIVI